MKLITKDDIQALDFGKRFIGIEDESGYLVRSFLCEVGCLFIRVFMAHWEPNSNYDKKPLEDWFGVVGSSTKFYLFDNQKELLTWLLEKADE